MAGRKRIHRTRRDKMKRTLQMAALLAAMAAASGCGSADPGDLIDELRAQSDEVGEAINEARAEIEAAMASISEECPAGWQFDLVTQFDDVNEDSEPARLYRRCRALAQWDLRGRQTWGHSASPVSSSRTRQRSVNIPNARPPSSANPSATGSGSLPKSNSEL